MDLDAIAVIFSAECTDEVVGVVDEKHGVSDVVFLGQLGQKLPSDRDRIRRKQPRMEDSIGFRIDGGVQPVLLIVDPDRLLIDRDAIRVFAACRL